MLWNKSKSGTYGPAYECFLTTGFQYTDFKKTLTKCDGNGKAYDRGDYNSSFALRAVELKL